MSDTIIDPFSAPEIHKERESKRRQIRAFFMSQAPKPGCAPRWIWGAFIVTLISFIFMFIFNDAIELFLLVFLGAGIFWFLGLMANSAYNIQNRLYKQKMKEWGLTPENLKNRPTGQQIDAWLGEDIWAYAPIVLKQLGILEEELVRKPPMLIATPIFWQTDGIPNDEIVVDKDNKGVLRFSTYRITFICLTANRIAAISASFNFLRNVLVNSKSTEFLYSDIVSITTEERSTNYKLPNGKTLREAQFFRVSVANGENIEVAITAPELTNVYEGDIRLSDHSQTVNVIRDLLREKKG